MRTITLGGQTLKTNDAGLVSLTDLYQAAQAAGWTDGKRDPRRWKLQDGAQFIAFVAENLNVPLRDIYKATKGKGGGSFAHWQIALAYAKYLSPELHMQVNEVYARFKAGDVRLAAEIADKAKPADAEWLARRVQGTVARNQLTSTLAAHGVVAKGFADCTNAIYRHVLGGKKSEVCAARGLRKSTNLRNIMTTEQLTVTAMSELVARKNIERLNARGNQSCTDHCDTASWRVMRLLEGGAA
ncbi:KilA-N domain-containing protein [Hydrogenophaga aromaticivorans]|uniref:KilA-N domain-containing protein n=1 Tax=Hydrogenophaga aromaticivorans TaxID=2610898 RepID=UPI001B37A632|nr:KilA-N domain-containing protein [Hydrogenophaga aromaticivorans]MBQ0917235.1 KilA-N domain-containing protein [Hydrogenophaga aromaticivorans]